MLVLNRIQTASLHVKLAPRLTWLWFLERSQPRLMLIYEKIVRNTCRNIGFVSADVGLDADNCKVLVDIEQQSPVDIEQQSPDIAQGVHGHFTKKPEEIGAGDQGHMLGYATDETPEFSPKKFTAQYTPQQQCHHTQQKPRKLERCFDPLPRSHSQVLPYLIKKWIDSAKGIESIASSISIRL
ncbi:hypothetical protein KIW84_030945 [Lathyrus oleraceus]|uniref:S-adenosylmethionine synthetase central domain-containing protein n=1 Tax=Pisum sativum TaxID=3888 RepID=A0A9D4XR29_PEA|nr:hypothetical protein KIW84_030945 [Pisum sativum]